MAHFEHLLETLIVKERFDLVLPSLDRCGCESNEQEGTHVSFFIDVELLIRSSMTIFLNSRDQGFKKVQVMLLATNQETIDSLTFAYTLLVRQS